LVEALHVAQLCHSRVLGVQGGVDLGGPLVRPKVSVNPDGQEFHLEVELALIHSQFQGHYSLKETGLLVCGFEEIDEVMNGQDEEFVRVLQLSGLEFGPYHQNDNLITACT